LAPPASAKPSANPTIADRTPAVAADATAASAASTQRPATNPAVDTSCRRRRPASRAAPTTAGPTTIIESRIEPAGPNRYRVIATIEIDPTDAVAALEPIGEGPTGDAIPDHIVRYLIRQSPVSASLAEIQAAVGGNARTVNRQAWTLANNAPDLQLRLRGWVTSPDRGRYALSTAAGTALTSQHDPAQDS
jgi:hypothetical protein